MVVADPANFTSCSGQSRVLVDGIGSSAGDATVIGNTVMVDGSSGSSGCQSSIDVNNLEHVTVVGNTVKNVNVSGGGTAFTRITASNSVYACVMSQNIISGVSSIGTNNATSGRLGGAADLNVTNFNVDV